MHSSRQALKRQVSKRTHAGIGSMTALTPTQRPGRRRLLQLAAISLLLASGCATVGRGSDLDAYQDALRRLLDDIAENNREQVRLASVARRIEIRSRDLLAEHQEFVGSFDSLMRIRDATEAQLRQAIDAYGKRRKWLRDDLLRLQDELHDALRSDEWPEVVEVLNRTGRAVARATVSGA